MNKRLLFPEQFSIARLLVHDIAAFEYKLNCHFIKVSLELPTISMLIIMYGRPSSDFDTDAFFENSHKYILAK